MLFKFKYPQDRILGLDILRSYAILIVIWVHAHVFFQDNISFNIFLTPVLFDGVSIFFVLSGFLIGGIIFKLVEQNKFRTPADIVRFWKRRWFRTLPNYYLVLLVLCCVRILVNPHLSWRILPGFFVFLQNFLWPHPDFFHEAWSLSVEEWFYLLIPIIFYFVFAFNNQRKKGSFLLVILMFMILPVILRYHAATRFAGYLDIDQQIRKVVVFRLDSLMYGVLGAFLKFYYYSYWVKYKKTLLITGLVLAAAYRYSLGAFHSIPMVWNAVFHMNVESILTLMWLPFLSEYQPVKKRNWHTFFTHISVISYSLYLLNHTVVREHLVPVFFNLTRLNQLSGFGLVLMKLLTYLILTFGGSYLLYMFWEKPMMDLRDKKFSFQIFTGWFSVVRSRISLTISHIKSLFQPGCTPLWIQLHQRDETRRISIVIMVFVVAWYYIMAIMYTPNIPLMDDFNAFIFTDYLSRTSDFWGKLKLFNFQANEHRIFSYVGLTYLDRLFTGAVNFSHLAFIGNLGLIGLLYLLSRLYQGFKSSWLLFLPVVFIMASPMAYISDWSIVAVAVLFQYFLIFTSLYLLSKNTTLAFAVSVLVALVANFSFGTGILTFVAGFIILLLDWRNQKLKLFIWASAMALGMIFYFKDYYLVNPFIIKVTVFDQPGNAIMYFLAFFGSAFQSLYGNYYLISVPLGLLILIYMMYLIVSKRQYFRSHPLSLAYLAVIVLSAFSATVARVGYGVRQATELRYILMPLLVLAILYILSFHFYKMKLLRYGALIILCTGVFYVVQLRFNTRIMNSLQVVAQNGLNQYYLEPDSSKLLFPDQKFAVSMMETAINGKYYNPPGRDLILSAQQMGKSYIPDKQTSNVLFNIEQTENAGNQLKLTGWIFSKDQDSRNVSIFLTAVSGNQKLVFGTNRLLRQDVAAFYKKVYPNNLEESGFTVSISKRFLPASKEPYKIGLLLKKDTVTCGFAATNIFF